MVSACIRFQSAFSCSLFIRVQNIKYDFFFVLVKISDRFLFVGVVDFAYGRNEVALREYRTLQFSVFAVFTLFSCGW